MSAETMPLNQAEHNKNQGCLVKRVKQEMGDKFILLPGEAEVKMSAVILDLAEDLLNLAKNKSQYQKAITVACLAWNLAVMFNTEQQKEKLEQFIKDMCIDDLQDQQDMRDVVFSIIQKKNYYYPDVDRIIIDHELIGSKNNFHLNVVSTVSQDTEVVGEVD